VEKVKYLLPTNLKPDTESILELVKVFADTWFSLDSFSLSLDGYDVGSYTAYPGVNVYRRCSFGLKCLGVTFAQDHGDLVAVDLAIRYDFSKFNVISEEEKTLFGDSIINAITNQEIIGYSQNGFVYLLKGDFVYIVNISWFTGERNAEILKKFTIQ
jgi:hypothetical protein